MFGMGWPEMVLILAVALIFIGPKKLPDLAKSLGRALGEFKKATNDFKESISMDSTLNEVKDEFKDMGKKMKEPLGSSSAKDKKDSATETEAVSADGDAAEAEKTEAADDQKSSEPPASDETDTEIANGEATETEKAAGSETEPSPDEPATSPADAENNTPDPAEAPEAGETTAEATSPDTTTEGPLKDA